MLASWRDTYHTNRRQSRYAEQYKNNEVISAQWEQMEWNQSCYLALGTSKGHVDIYHWWHESELDWDHPIFEYEDKDQRPVVEIDLKWDVTLGGLEIFICFPDTVELVLYEFNQFLTPL